MSISWQSADPAPGLLVLPPAAASLDEAHAAIELWEHYSRKTLDSSQRLAVELMMAETTDGLWAAATTGRSMPRQNGKGDEIEVPELWGLVQRSEAILHTVHDAVLLATQAQQRLLSVLESHADLRRLIKRVWKGTGQQMIEMRNGGTIWYRTRTGGGGRGVDDIDRLVVDEAQHATEEQLAAVSPTLMANANPQLNALGSAGIEGKSAWWWGLRKRALTADPGAFAYLEHTAERVELDGDGNVVQYPVDTSDRRLWAIANPAVGAGRGGGMAFLEEQSKRLRDRFACEHLNVWDPPPLDVGIATKLPADKWAATVRPDHQLPKPEVGKVTVTLAVDRDGISASTAVGVGSQLDPYVEVTEFAKGTGWLPAAVVDMVRKWEPLALACNGAGATGAQVGPVIAALRDAGLAIAVPQLGAKDWARACQGFFVDVVEGRLRRPDGQGPLDVAAGDAAERPVGDGWAWDARQATVALSPLEAATAARAVLPVKADEDRGPIVMVVGGGR